MGKLMIVLLVIVLSVVTALSWPSDVEADESSWTKAICDDSNFCIDIEIRCINEKVVDIKPVKYGVQFEKAWVDPRPMELQNILC